MPVLCHRPQVSEQLSDALEAKEQLQDQVKAMRERAEAGELSMAALKQQLAEAQKNADMQERRYSVRLGSCVAACSGLHPAMSPSPGSHLLFPDAPPFCWCSTPRLQEAMTALDAREQELGDKAKEAADAVTMLQQSQVRVVGVHQGRWLVTSAEGCRRACWSYMSVVVPAAGTS